eukprot:SAG11_NODE_7237_length_1172_cov_1.439070_1_plen_26_part_10
MSSQSRSIQKHGLVVVLAGNGIGSDL